METEQQNSTENAEKNREQTEFKRDEKGWFVAGTAPGPGRPAGMRDFATDFDEVVEEIAKEEGITISEARKILLRRAYDEAKSGKFSFYKDTMDRYYGEAKKQIDLTSKGEKINELPSNIKELIDDFENKLKKEKI